MGVIEMEEEVLKKVAEKEGVSPEVLRGRLDKGTVILVKNRRRSIEPLAIGEGLRIKINANIGTSPDRSNLQLELEKLQVAIEAGADTVMDLSTGGDLDEIRREIIAASSVPVGSVPIYQAACEAQKKQKSFVELSGDEIFEIIERHLEDGIDFITVHCGVTQEGLERLRTQPRLAGVVSRGGTMMIEWMRYNDRENPLYEEYDRLLKLAKKYGATLSLGDGLRPGALRDATDAAQIQELVIIGDLVARARAEGVSVMVEGPGHVPMHEIEANVRAEKTICKGAPFYVLGPLVTDVAPGYDHITGAIGGALAAYFGADFLCYVTPAEHLRLPDVEDVRVGVIAARIAAHAADVARGLPGARDWDDALSEARAQLQWTKVLSLAIDPDRARQLFDGSPMDEDQVCTMCGEFCAVRRSRRLLTIQ